MVKATQRRKHQAKVIRKTPGNGQVYCWGNNSQEQLGSNGSVGVDTYTPTQINLPD